MRRLLALLILGSPVVSLALKAQSNSGELRLKLTDPSGSAVKGSIELVCDANQFRQTYVTDNSGAAIAKRLAFGVYEVGVRQAGFAPYHSLVEIRSAVPEELRISLGLASVNTSVTVNDTETLVDPHRTGSVNRIGSETLEARPTALPGRSVVDLVNSQPGWLYEGNAVLHPRGSEYHTQFVVDGVPLTDNRSPSFGTEIEADDVQSLSIYTANIPAEYGRKLGGVVEVTTAKDPRLGFHGKAALTGGSFATGSAYLLGEYARPKDAVSVSLDGARTDRFLNPPVAQNFSNQATTADFSARYERDFSESDRIGLTVRHGLSRFEVPNEQLQQAAGQRQDRANSETMGILSYQHIFSPNVLGDLRLMVRDDSDTLGSNPLSTPIIAFQDRGFREEYLKGSVSAHHGRHEWKVGVEADFTSIRENFRDVITDAAQFAPGTQASFRFAGTGRDLEQSGFVQDFIRLGKWTASAGLRWDHYQLLVNQNAVSPRLGIARYVPALDLVLHASYDRVFQTPAFENILLSSSAEVVALNPNVLRLPVEPSLGNYYEAGATKGFAGRVKLDVNYFRRNAGNFADDDQLLNTGVSFPIAFRKSSIYGAEGKLEIPHLGNLSGFVSYSYMVGSTYLPVTGGLFLGDDAANALSKTVGRFWDTQDQRHTARTRFRYVLTPRLWAALGAEYGSGLPVAFEGSVTEAIAQYGPEIIDRVNFARNRVKPSFSLDASAGAEIWKHDSLQVRVQADAANLTNRLNLIDF
ncbi:MAG TPA: TonB-dependent receptor, partial [Candidatus Acidoferrum sp.]|nr:TonB-dependent receptor [Candidatus Acidoferrum sp.]